MEERGRRKAWALAFSLITHSPWSTWRWDVSFFHRGQWNKPHKAEEGRQKDRDELEMFITVKKKGKKKEKKGKKLIVCASAVYTHRDLGCCNPLSPWMLLINIMISQGLSGVCCSLKRMWTGLRSYVKWSNELSREIVWMWPAGYKNKKNKSQMPLLPNFRETCHSQNHLLLLIM